MENFDLKYIKKHYGEHFAHLCRSSFPLILEKKGKLLEIIATHFAPSRNLYNDLVKYNAQDDFKDYVLSFFDSSIEQIETSKTNKSPEELFDEAGYILYPECKTNEEVLYFKKYYTYNELLCTFYGDRLDTCRIWFAVKKNVDEIKRENFDHPQRQDEYGTSVLSIQFTRDRRSTLSIKNRYNHTVFNPDATFSNNLDNIAKGLMEAFTNKFNIITKKSNVLFTIPNYIQDENNCFHKYNVQVTTKDCIYYFCENNLIIRFEIDENRKQNFKRSISFDRARYILIDNYLVDLSAKKIVNYNEKDYVQSKDAFIESLGKYEDIKVEINEEGNKVLSFISENKSEVIVTLSSSNQIIGYQNEDLEYIGDNFLPYNKNLKEIIVNNVKYIGKDFLKNCEDLKSLNLNAEIIGDGFLRFSSKLQNLQLPNAVMIGDDFLSCNEKLVDLSLPNVEQIGEGFMCYNDNLAKISAPKLRNIGERFLFWNGSLKTFNFQNLTKIKYGFLSTHPEKKKIIKAIRMLQKSNKEKKPFDLVNI